MGRRVKDGGVALEHLFSKAGYLISKLRSRLSPDNVNKLVFLARNENLYFEVRLVEFHKRCLNICKHVYRNSRNYCMSCTWQ